MSEIQELPIIEMAVTDKTFGDAEEFLICSANGTPVGRITRGSAAKALIREKALRMRELNDEIARMTHERDEIHSKYGDKIQEYYFELAAETEITGYTSCPACNGTGCDRCMPQMFGEGE